MTQEEIEKVNSLLMLKYNIFHADLIHAATPIGRYNIDNFGIWLLRFNGKEIPLSTGSSLEEAKQAANEHYKRQIKQALGL